LRATSHLFYL